MRRTKHCGMSIVVLALAGPAWAITIDFEDWTGGPAPHDVIVSGGFSFSGNVAIYPPLTPNNATNALHVGEVTVKTAPAGLGLFNLLSIDLHEGTGNVASVKLVGYLPGPGQIVQTIGLDGDLSTFETFQISDFSGIDSLYLYGYDVQGGYAGGFAVDNMVVPEPNIAILALLGVVVLSANPKTVDQRLMSFLQVLGVTR